MTEFVNESDIESKKIPSLHPSSNPAEVFMRPLGKTMKIAHMNKNPEKYTLEQLLDNYRGTPYSATGLVPSAMLFSNDKHTSFPRQSVRERDIEIAREHDEQWKEERTEQINASKYRKEDVIELRDELT